MNEEYKKLATNIKWYMKDDVTDGHYFDTTLHNMID
jgi:hypothetical protein